MKKLTRVLVLVLTFSMAFSVIALANSDSPKYKILAEDLPYKSAASIDENLIVVSDGTSRGYIDFDGKIIVKPHLTNKYITKTVICL